MQLLHTSYMLKKKTTDDLLKKGAVLKLVIAQKYMVNIPYLWYLRNILVKVFHSKYSICNNKVKWRWEFSGTLRKTDNNFSIIGSVPVTHLSEDIFLTEICLPYAYSNFFLQKIWIISSVNSVKNFFSYKKIVTLYLYLNQCSTQNAARKS